MERVQFYQKLTLTIILVGCAAVITYVLGVVLAPRVLTPDASTAASISVTDPPSTPVAVPHVTVNGRTVPVDAQGNGQMTTGSTQVNVAPGTTRVVTNGSNGTSTNSNEDVNVLVLSDSNRNGSTQSHVSVSGTNTSNRNFSSSVTTQVFSTGTAHTTITP